MPKNSDNAELLAKIYGLFPETEWRDAPFDASRVWANPRLRALLAEHHIIELAELHDWLLWNSGRTIGGLRLSLDRWGWFHIKPVARRGRRRRDVAREVAAMTE